MKILIAGASGFIGHALIESLLMTDASLEIVALSRRARPSTHPRVQWKVCDLFSLKDLSECMEGCDMAYYLVHSMLPSASLSQGSFYDFDLILADNFARSAKRFKLQHLVYLGGMIPVGEKLSWHLKSRLEVEETLRSSGVPVTTLRAGLIIGKQGSSFEILKKLVERLPLMVCPAWTLTESQPIALQDIVKVLVNVLTRADVQGKIYDVGGPEVLTYQKLILKTAHAMKRNPKMVSFTLIPLKFSRFWVRLITGASKNLVYPLVLSLKHRMVVNAKLAWPDQSLVTTPILKALEDAMSADSLKSPSRKNVGEIPSKDVRSIQRLVLPTGKNAEWISSTYFSWLSRFFAFIVWVEVKGGRCSFHLIFKKISLLVLEKSEERSTSDRQLLYIKGGLLAADTKRGRLEFREVLNRKYVMAAVHEFRPRMPWFVYRYTHAYVHLFVMKSFGKFLSEFQE